MVKKIDIQILVVNHKPSYVPDNKLLKPIQVGVAISGKKLDGMVYYDSDGKDNISDKNRSYCELTAIYWAWKNLEADYYGLFHYRRYLSFSPKQADSPYAGQAYRDVESAVPEIDLNEKTMRKMIERYDMIIPRKDDTRSATNDKSIYEQYRNEHNIGDMDYCIDYISKKYPDIAPFTEVLHTSKAYFCNMFIMKKEIFRNYCEFMFDVLGSFDENNDISGYSVHQYRVNGFLAERLTNVYIHYLQSLDKYKIKELQMAYFENTDPKVKLLPAAKNNNVAIVLAANNYYVPYISTLIHSIAECSSSKNTYDIIVFHQDITSDNMNMLRSEFANLNNFSIRFYDMSSRANEYSRLFTKWHFTVETYFRLFIQDIMVDYKKILYLDGDMVAKSDVAELYSENIDDYLLAACRDIDMAGVYNSNGFRVDDTIDPKRKEYIDKVLKIKSPFDYFQAGVILFNLEEMRKKFNTKKALEFAASRQWEYLDQDVLNFFAQGNVKYLDSRWNVLYDWEFVRIKNVISKAPVNMYLEYMESRKNPRIIHYGGTIKPWQRADCDFGNEYWRVARKSEYYELILGRMSDWRVKNIHESFIAVEKVHLPRRLVRKMRHVADRVAPMGTSRRRPLTITSRAIKKVVYRSR